MTTTMEQFAPGFRFYPTEEELVSFYLRNKLEGKRLQLNRVIPVVAVYELEPWHLPKLSGELCHGDTEQWFFFVPRQERETRGSRPTRTTGSGYWKTTGSPSYVYSSNNKVIGVKKTLVFYKGKAPSGGKTKWKMNEYRAIGEELPFPSTSFSIPKLRHELSLCRVYVVSGSLRAFDRRPLGTTTVDQNPKLDKVLTSSHSNTVTEKTSSTGSSCSGEHHLKNTEGNTIWDTVNGIEPPLLDWEQLNWL